MQEADKSHRKHEKIEQMLLKQYQKYFHQVQN